MEPFSSRQEWPPYGSADFKTTHWSHILVLGGTDSRQASAALEALCVAYWYPLYAHARRSGLAPEDAQDVIQGFFSSLLARRSLETVNPAKGKFRSFLLGSLNHFLANERRYVQADKRGGGCAQFSLDAVAAEERYHLEPVDHETPDRLFDRRWALAVLDRSLRRLDAECAGADRVELFEALKGTLTGAAREERYVEIAARLGLTEAAVKKAAQRLRDRYRELLREVVGETVSDPGEVDGEIRQLLEALRN